MMNYIPRLFTLLIPLIPLAVIIYALYVICQNF